MKNVVTMRDIGRELGVSAVTVNKALAGRGGVSASLRERILAKAAEMGYRYALAQRASAPTQADVGILIPDHFMGAGNSFYASLCKKLVQQLADRGCYGVLGILSEEEELGCCRPAMLEDGRVGGLVVLGQVHPAYLQMLDAAQQEIPYLCMDFYDDSADADAVVSDGLYGGDQLTSHLIHRGHTRIGFVGSITATSSIMDRYLGYHRSMLTHGLPIDAAWTVPDRDCHGAYKPYPLPDPLPTAFVCNCDQLALQLVQRLKELGLAVPGDVSVVGFDDYVDAGGAEPPLTTFAVDQDALAREAANLILQKMRGGNDRVGRVVVGGRLVTRASVRDLRDAQPAQTGIGARPHIRKGKPASAVKPPQT